MSNPKKHVISSWFQVGILTLNLLLLYFLKPFLSGFFGAITIYILAKPAFRKLNAVVKQCHLSALLILSLVYLVIIVPFSVVMTTAIVRLRKLLNNSEQVEGFIRKAYNEIIVTDRYNLTDTLGVDLSQFISSWATTFSKMVTFGTVWIAGNFALFVTNLFIMAIVLYFLFTHDDKLFPSIQKYWPFKQKYLDDLCVTVDTVTRAAVYSSGIIVLIQGILLGTVFVLTGVPNATLLGIVVMIVSFLPIIGTAIIWVPSALYMLMNGDVSSAGVIAVTGVVASNMDGVLRAILQDRIGSIHPIVTICGIILGLSLFGFIGLIIGPIFVAVMLQLSRMVLEDLSQPLV